MMFKLNSKSKVYVLCPAYLKTGGPELLHQLVYKLNTNNVDAFITYFKTDVNNTNYRDPAFDVYTDQYKLVSDIEDDENNLIVSPETGIRQMDGFKKIQKCIWWLSVDNFTETCGVFYPIKKQGIRGYIKNLLNGRNMLSFNRVRKIEYHLCQSYYAIDFLENKGINKKKIVYLSDYLNKQYLEIKNKKLNKKDNVLYNPRKGFEFTKKIIEKSSDFNWIPITGMTNQQVKDLLLESKVYIDFGNHPGKDRFPREAAICNCCVITGKRGAAKFYNDVPIDDEFKFEDKEENIDRIIDKIRICLNDYENQIKKFDGYRNFIKSEEESFGNDVKKIFTINKTK